MTIEQLADGPRRGCAGLAADFFVQPIEAVRICLTLSLTTTSRASTGSAPSAASADIFRRRRHVIAQPVHVFFARHKLHCAHGASRPRACALVSMTSWPNPEVSNPEVSFRRSPE